MRVGSSEKAETSRKSRRTLASLVLVVAPELERRRVALVATPWRAVEKGVVGHLTASTKALAYMPAECVHPRMRTLSPRTWLASRSSLH